MPRLESTEGDSPPGADLVFNMRDTDSSSTFVATDKRQEPRRADDIKPTNPKDLAGMAKPPMSTVSKLVLAELGVAMLEGATKYGKFNYRGTEVLASVYLDAAGRHLTAWEEGQDIDPGSGLNHITKAIAAVANNKQ